MAIDAQTLKAKIDAELAGVPDARVVAYIRGLLVEPKPAERLWDYGAPGERYTCWTVLENGSVGVAYCEQGFGPKHPWGLVFLNGDDWRQSIGMDSGWYAQFLDAVGEEALSGLPIWRVVMTPALGASRWLTGEDSWEQTWEKVMALRAADNDSRYDCRTSVLPWGAPGRELA